MQWSFEHFTGVAQVGSCKLVSRQPTAGQRILGEWRKLACSAIS